MIRKLLGLVVLAGAVLFGWYFFTDNTLRTNKEKAKDAAGQVVEAFKDAGVEGLVKTTLLQTFGYENSRYLHTTNDNGHIVVYGMAPPAVNVQQLTQAVHKVSGVVDVEVSVVPLTPNLALRRGASPSAPAPTP
jgi:hypothetical protein